MRQRQLFSLLSLFFTITTNNTINGAVFSSARRSGQSNPTKQSSLLKHDNDETEQRRRQISVEEYLTPDFEPPRDDRPPVDYGGRHPNEDNYVPEENCYVPLRIELATHQLEDLKSSTPYLAPRIDTLMDEILPNVVNMWSNALSVIPVSGNLFHQASTCGMADVPMSFQTVGVPDTDLIVYVVAVQNDDDSCSDTTLAFAGPCEYDQHFRPIAGRVVICVDNIFVDETGAVYPDEIEFQTSILTHEFAHILGVSSEMMQYYKDENFVEYGSTFQTNVDCVDGTVRNITVPAILNQVSEPGEATYFEITSPKVRRIVQNHFNCLSLNGARFENQPSTPTCFGYRFEERIFHGDWLSSIAVSSGNTALSPLTLALLEDSSWYKPDYTQAANSPFGQGAGCSFVEDECIVNGNVPDYSRGYFCNEKIPWADTFLGDEDQVQYGCDPFHQQKAVCDLIDYSEEILGLLEAPPSEFQNFPNPAYGSYYIKESDYCPIKHLYSIDCSDSSLQANAAFGETYGEESKCYEAISGDSLCLETLCDHVNHRVDVVVNGEIHQCDDDFQILSIPGLPDIECPRLASICPSFNCPSGCSGRGRCDYDAQPPRCVCDDPNDLSDGCYEYLPTCPFYTNAPSEVMSLFPTSSPSLTPSTSPTVSFQPSTMPSTSPTTFESSPPSMTQSPSSSPVIAVSEVPSTNPTESAKPSTMPSTTPTASQFPSTVPSLSPTMVGSAPPSVSSRPSSSPIVAMSESPSTNPSASPKPSTMPSSNPVRIASASPTLSAMPSTSQSMTPSTSLSPSAIPSSAPSMSQYPSDSPSGSPMMDASVIETSYPTGRPTTSQVFITSAPTPTVDCFDDWNMLEASIESSSGGTFIICPNTVLYPMANDFSAISFPENADFVILCGANGNSTNNCTVMGGTSHFVIAESTSSVTIRGLEMRGAAETSILAHGGEGATASFYDCTWKHNYGDFGGAIDIWTRSNKAMTVNFEECYFTENGSDFGAVNIEAGDVTFDNCHFLSNMSYETVSGSAISVRQEHDILGQLNIINCCFTYNDALKGYGTVFVEEGTTIGNVYQDNHGAENMAGGLNGCSGIYEEEGDVCIEIPK